MGINQILENLPRENIDRAKRYKQRLLEYSNPVEFVNNMYGCHPDDTDGNYFQAIYK